MWSWGAFLENLRLLRHRFLQVQGACSCNPSTYQGGRARCASKMGNRASYSKWDPKPWGSRSRQGPTLDFYSFFFLSFLFCNVNAHFISEIKVSEFLSSICHYFIWVLWIWWITHKLGTITPPKLRKIKEIKRCRKYWAPIHYNRDQVVLKILGMSLNMGAPYDLAIFLSLPGCIGLFEMLMISYMSGWLIIPPLLERTFYCEDCNNLYNFSRNLLIHESRCPFNLRNFFPWEKFSRCWSQHECLITCLFSSQ